MVADDSSTSLASGPLARLNAVFAALPDVSSKAAIDQLAVDFAFLNSKASRKRLIKVPMLSLPAYRGFPLLTPLAVVVYRRRAQEPI